MPTVTQEELHRELVETIQDEMNELNLSGIPGAGVVQRAISGLRGGKPAKGPDNRGLPTVYRRPEPGSTTPPDDTQVPPDDTQVDEPKAPEEKAIPILKGKAGVSLQSFVDKMGGSDPEIKGVVRSTILKHVAQQLTKQGVKIMQEEHIALAHEMIAEEFINFLDEANVAIYNHPNGKEHSLNGALQQLRTGGATGIEKEKLGKLLNAITRWAKSHALNVTEEIENNIVRMLEERSNEATQVTEQNRWKELSGIK